MIFNHQDKSDFIQLKMNNYADQLLSEFIQELQDANKLKENIETYEQLNFHYEKQDFQTDYLKNKLEIIQMLFESELNEEQIKNSLNLMKKFGVEKTGQFQHYGPEKLKKLGINDEQITNLRYVLGKYVNENLNDQEQQFISSELIQELDILKQRMQKLDNKLNGYDILQYPLYQLKEIHDIENYKTIIVLGETGTGKTTFIDYYVNHYHGVQLDDKFRIKLIQEQKKQSQAISQTEKVTEYYIKPFSGQFGIRIIDTPGYLDTKGVERDLEITKQIENCFKTQVDSLSTICFLIRSQTMRLSTSQNYILTSILQMFGKDIIKNFVFIFTFFDGTEEPQAIDSLKFKGDASHPRSPVVELLDQMNEPWYLKLNNVSMINGKQNPITQIYWNYANQCFNELYTKKIIQNQQQTLKLTREVIEKREQIFVIVKKIRQQIQQQLDEIANIKQIQYHIKQLDQQIEGSKNFKVKQKVNLMMKHRLAKGYHTTNCIKCNQTCHYPCRASINNMKKCAAIVNGKCQVCKGKCSWEYHKNQDFIITYKIEEKIQEIEEIKQLYIQGKIQREKQKQMIESLEQKLTNLQAQCLTQQVELKQIINDLKKISLQDPVCFYQEQFAETMIQQEYDIKNFGYQDRISALIELREFCKTLRETETSLGSVVLTQEFLEKNLVEWKKQNLQKNQ